MKIFIVFVGFDKATSGRTYPEPRREREDKTARVRDGKNEGKGKEKSCHKGSCSLQKKSKLCLVKIVHVTLLCIKMHQPYLDAHILVYYFSIMKHLTIISPVYNIVYSCTVVKVYYVVKGCQYSACMVYIDASTSSQR